MLAEERVQSPARCGSVSPATTVGFLAAFRGLSGERRRVVRRGGIRVTCSGLLATAAPPQPSLAGPFEIVAVLNARITKVAACIGEVGDPAPVAAFVEDGGEVDMDSVRKTLWEQSVFSTRVLAVTTGSITGEVPILPPFSDPVFERLVGDKDVGRDALENLCFDYAQVSS